MWNAISLGQDLNSYRRVVTHKEKRPSRMPVNLKKTEFAPAGVQAGSYSRTFHPEATSAGGKVQSKKNYNGWKAHSHIYSMVYRNSKIY